MGLHESNERAVVFVVLMLLVGLLGWAGDHILEILGFCALGVAVYAIYTFGKKQPPNTPPPSNDDYTG